MSAPRTNIEKQKRRHVVPLVGMAVGLIFVAFLFLGNLGDVASEGQTPEQTSATVDGRTGDVDPVTPSQGDSGPAGSTTTADVPATEGSMPAEDSTGTATGDAATAGGDTGPAPSDATAIPDGTGPGANTTSSTGASGATN